MSNGNITMPNANEFDPSGLGQEKTTRQAKKLQSGHIASDRAGPVTLMIENHWRIALHPCGAAGWVTGGGSKPPVGDRV